MANPLTKGLLTLSEMEYYGALEMIFFIIKRKKVIIIIPGGIMIKIEVSFAAQAEEMHDWLGKTEMSVEDFASKLEMHYSTVSKWVAGMNQPSDVSKMVIALKFPHCPLLK